MFCITATELKKIREKFKLSQEQVPIGAGIAQSSISRSGCGEGCLSMADQLIDNTLIDAAVKDAEGIPIPVEKLATLFSPDMTLTEITAAVSYASIKLTQNIEFTIRDMLEESTKRFHPITGLR